ncbi:MAG: outer membrane protein assembly factor BamD [Hyphomicrobiales bacterium]|nr:outer membrane protein assembly factor BamD [Hyphomicrobiales bacterium]
MSACSSDEDSQLAFQDEPVGKLYNEALSLLAEENYRSAAAKFEDVERQHPYSEWARKAIVMAAFAYYQSRSYEEAIQAAKRYVTLHPGGEDAAYAQFLIAQSYYDQIPDVTRDQQRTESAMEGLREVVRRYPETDYARDARKKLQQASDQLAGKEMEIGRYYLRHNDYVAALNRFKTVVKNYQTSSQIEEALMRLTEAYMAMGITSEAQTATAILGHNYPTSPWYKDAFALLQSGGLEPREDKGSWLSSVWKTATGT